MPSYIQADRPIAVATPLGDDVLLLVGFKGQEAISQLFRFELELIAENEQKIAFDKLLGQNITVSLASVNEQTRYFSGICNRVAQGGRD
ncbi:MAG TPA: contractile injection system protein, VgrG/Pvc8 family, partial [Pyrinomonadaceae bacterium]